MKPTALVLLVCLTGCAQPADFDPDACSAFTHTQEFGLAWERVNHRVSLWDVRPTEGCISDALEAGAIGGDFSTGAILTDTPRVRYVHRTIWSSPDRLGARPITFAGTIGPDGRLEATETFTREKLELEGYTEMTAVVRGLRFSTDAPYSDDAPEDLTYDQRFGWTMRAVGAGVAANETDDEVDVTWWVEFEPGAAPDRPDHNAAMPYAQFEAALDVVVIGVNDAPIHKGSNDYGIYVEAPRPGTPLVVEHASPEDQLQVVDGKPGEQPGFVGVRSFRHDFDIDDSCDADSDCGPGVGCDSGTCALPNGEYVREISVAADLEAYDIATGEATIRYDGFGSTATPILMFQDLDFRTDADWVWVQAGLRGETHKIDSDFQTGRSRWELER